MSESKKTVTASGDRKDDRRIDQLVEAMQKQLSATPK
jgi:hypothetical protein